MALNCSMITPNNLPVPLPGEKIFMSVKAVTIYLNPTTTGAGTTSEAAPLSPTAPSTLPVAAPAASHDAKQKGKLSLSGMLSAISLVPGSSDDGSAHGTIYVTNQRILFIADDASASLIQTDPPSSTDPTPSLPPIKTLTIPLRNSFDGRFIQPWLSANYHLSTFIPVPNGNLQHLSASNPAHDSNIAQDSFTLKIIFNEGHGFEFTEALEEVKNIMYQSESQRSAELEELPEATAFFIPATYSPPMADPIPLATPSSFVGCPMQQGQQQGQDETAGNGGEDEGGRPAMDDYLSRRRETLPEADLLLAASVVTEEERLQEQQVLSNLPPLPNILPPPDHPPSADDAPPGYEP
ncbi:hypothetical protein VP01_218g9 [Puccinia sorghi]|uniref:GRAM domain-containing protein n=1 Tax=Puccinia sorghi TaxID=27349 RepID=A0A0L6V936_9BASI|nr:hypothetical protein VP01_218g9 [Puccinia sorghi]